MVGVHACVLNTHLIIWGTLLAASAELKAPTTTRPATDENEDPQSTRMGYSGGSRFCNRLVKGLFGGGPAAADLMRETRRAATHAHASPIRDQVVVHRPKLAATEP